ncbi:uncharacterized protein LOC127161234 [Labeo rohita]|uniref:uncharacterized protein LOC127161234 n=1 Tax=Labeo rohita TaxID=84645 RepID=UPI0021E25604|nr:uncharacterized protein LOC127161234 [Labeo rohita]
MFLRFWFCLWCLVGDADAVKSVMEGDSVTLHTPHSEMMDNDLIQWRFGNKNTLLVEINVIAGRVTVNYNYAGRSRGRLKVNRRTRCLTIKHIRTEDAGHYRVQTNRIIKVYIVNVQARLPVPVICNSSLSSGSHPIPISNQTQPLNINELCQTCSGDADAVKSVMEGDSVTLHTPHSEMMDNDLIQWRFGNKNTLLVGINVIAGRVTVNYNYAGRSRGRLKVNRRTRCLTIKNIRTEDAGRYRVQTNRMIKVYIVNVQARLPVPVICNSSLSSGSHPIPISNQTQPLNINELCQTCSGGKLLKSVSVMEGDSVTLNSDLTEMIDNELIKWRFGTESTLIAEINVMTDNITTYNDDNDDGRFRDRLKLDNQTGSLTITNTTTEHAGVYLLEINHIRMIFLLNIFGGVKSVSVLEGDLVTLNFDLTEIMDDDLILWRFGNENTLIAEFNAEADSMTVYDDVLDGRFRDRLKLDNQTGSLTITNTTTEHVGVYQRQTNRMIKSFILTVYGELNIGASTLWGSHPNYISNKNQHHNITELCRTCSDSVHYYDSVEAVVRLVVTALMGMAAAAAVIVLIYDIKSRRADFLHSSSSKRDIGSSISGEWSQFEMRTRD